MSYVAGKRLQTGQGVREKGDLVPEAETWPHLSVWLNAGDIVYIPDSLVEHYSKSDEDAVIKAPHRGVPQTDSDIESLYHSRDSSRPQKVVDETPSDAVKESDNIGESDSVEPESDLPEYIDDPSSFKAKEVVDYAKEHPEHAEMLYDAEAEGKNRSTVLSGLKSILESAL